MPYQVPRDFVKPAIKGSVSLTETEHVITVIGDSFSAQVSKDDVLLHSLKYSEREMVVTPLRPNFWRPLTDNDARTHTLFVENLIIWKSALEGMKVKDILIGGFGSKRVVVKASLVLPKVNSLLILTYQFSPDGAVEINFNFQGGANQPDMFRLGMAMEIPQIYDQLTWYGLGPQETYWD